MNGATPVPDRKISRPNSTTTAMMGNSHHLRVDFRNPHSSPRNPTSRLSDAAFSKLFSPDLVIPSILTQIAPHVCSGRLRFPVARLVLGSVTCQPIAALQPEQQDR